MSTNFPTSIDSYSSKSNGQVIQAADVNNPQDAIVALETKVGINSSSVASSLDYKVTNPLSLDPGHKHSTSTITAGGTPSSTTYLDGLGNWSTPSGGLGCGDGSDGNVTVGSASTISRDMYYNNLTINNTLTTNGHKVFVKGAATGNGTLSWGTPNAGGNASGATPGSAGAANTSGGIFFLNQAGAAGSSNNAVNGTSSGSITRALGAVGGTGGSAGNDTRTGGTGGTITAPLTKFGVYSDLTLKGTDYNQSTTSFLGVYNGSTGGGGGAGGFNSGAGGGGGASGGIVWACINNWDGTFTISAPGGAGGNGSTTANGGGGGGAGGVAVILYRTKTWSGTYNLQGGAAGSNTAGAGVSPTQGTTGVSYEIALPDLTR